METGYSTLLNSMELSYIHGIVLYIWNHILRSCNTFEIFQSLINLQPSIKEISKDDDQVRITKGWHERKPIIHMRFLIANQDLRI